MRIVCEYCDSSFESKGNTKCPNCGAAFTDPTVKQAEREFKAKTETEKKRLELEQQRLEIEKQKVQVESDRALYSFIGNLLRGVHIFPRLSSVRYSIRRGIRKIWRFIVIVLVLIALYFIATKFVPQLDISRYLQSSGTAVSAAGTVVAEQYFGNVLVAEEHYPA